MKVTLGLFFKISKVYFKKKSAEERNPKYKGCIQNTPNPKRKKNTNLENLEKEQSDILYFF
jgi:hypothetical protein